MKRRQLVSVAAPLALLALACGASPPPPADSTPPPSSSAPSTPSAAPSASPPVASAAPSASGAAPRPEGVVCTMDMRRCPDGTDVGRSGPRCEFAPCPEAKTCTTNADCGSGEACVGALGCDEAWHCAKVPCTRDLVTYCGCDGKTFQGSGSCPSRKAKKRGSC